MGIIVPKEGKPPELRMVGGEWRYAKGRVGKSGEEEREY